MKPGEWKLFNEGATCVGRGIWIELGDDLPAPGEGGNTKNPENGRWDYTDVVDGVWLKANGTAVWITDDGFEAGFDEIRIPPQTVTIPAEATDAMVEQFCVEWRSTQMTEDDLRAAINAAIRAGMEEVNDD